MFSLKNLIRKLNFSKIRQAQMRLQYRIMEDTKLRTLGYSEEEIKKNRLLWENSLSKEDREYLQIASSQKF